MPTIKISLDEYKKLLKAEAHAYYLDAFCELLKRLQRAEEELERIKKDDTRKVRNNSGET